MDVPFGLRDALVTALAKAGFADNATRILLHQVVSDLLGHPLNIPEHPVGRDNLMEIVNGCAKDEHGLTILADAVEVMRPESTDAKRVRRLVEDPPVVDLLPKAESDRLRNWLSGITSPRMPMLAQRAAGPGVPPISPKADAWEAFSYLTDFNAGINGFPPAMAFLEILAGQLTGYPKAELAEWNDVQARRFRLEPELRELRTSTAEPIPDDAVLYLVLAVQPDGINPDRFLVSHWRQDDPDQWPPIRGESRVTTREQLERSIDDVVCEAETAWADRSYHAALEFILPRGLLQLPVHHWRMEHDSADPQPLIVHYPIVIRSLERMTSVRWHRVWRLRWQMLSSDPESAGVYFGHTDGNTESNQLAAALSDPRWALLVLSGSPPEKPLPGVDELSAGLRAGLPALLWHPHASPEILQKFVTRLSEGGGLGDLPMRVHESRIEALQKASDALEESLGLDCVLLWDDAQRMINLDQPRIQPRPRSE